MVWSLAVVHVLAVLADYSHYVRALDVRRGSSPVNESHTDRLREDLSHNYDKFAVPSLAAPTDVKISLDVKHVTLSEMQSVVSMNAWLKMEWLDSRLSWRSSEADYGNLKAILMHRMDVWHPDIGLKNSFSGKGEGLYEGSMIVVNSDGRVEWVPSVVLEAFCNLDLRNWPFERHECDFVLGSWTLGTEQLHIGNATCNVDEVKGQGGEFLVESVVVKALHPVQIGSNMHEEVAFTVALHRQPGTYRAVIFAPAFVVVILCLSTFLLPPRSGEKVVLGGVNAMLICVFLIYFAHSLPVLTNQTPLIVIFYSSSLYLVCFSLVIAVLVLNLSRQHHSQGIPWCIKKILTGSCGRFLLLSSYIEQIMDARCPRTQEERPVVLEDQMGQVDQLCQAEPDGLSSQGDWVLLAVAIDRVIFIIYSLLFVALAIVFHV